MNADAALIGIIAGAVTAALSFAAFWMALGGRISRAQSTAENAEQAAASLENELRDVRTQQASLGAAFSIYREQAIEKFVTHQAVSQMEKRVIEAQAKGEQRMADAFEQLTRRIDKLIDTQGRA